MSLYRLNLYKTVQVIYNDNLSYFDRRYLRETLKMANAEDLNRLTSCSLVLLGHIFLSLGNTRESMNMVTPAMQLASKIPDIHVQLWASSILKGKTWLMRINITSYLTAKLSYDIDYKYHSYRSI